MYKNIAYYIKKGQHIHSGVTIWEVNDHHTGSPIEREKLCAQYYTHTICVHVCVWIYVRYTILIGSPDS